MSGACEIRVGTCGYSYPEWVEAGFYPPGTRAADMLPLYARHFSVTELNFTWYQMPKAPALERMLRLAPPGFAFTAKLTRTLTHEVDPGRWRGQVALYREGVSPLLEERRLLAVLLQFPASFVRAPASRLYLAQLIEALEGLPLAVEFRHASWAEERVFRELARRRVSLAVLDAPPLPGLFPTVEEVTHPGLFYVRLHGRNARGWRSGNLQQQFDYDYSEAELRGWAEGAIPRLAARAARGVIVFNNHVRAQAARNALGLQRLLAASGLAPAPAPWSAASST